MTILLRVINTKYKFLSVIPTQVGGSDVKKSFKCIGEILYVGVAHAKRDLRDIELPVEEQLAGVVHPGLLSETEEATAEKMTESNF